MLLVTVAVDFSVELHQAVESGLIGRNAAVQVFALKVDVIGPAVYIVISPSSYGAAVDPGGDIREGYLSAAVMDISLDISEVQGRNMELLHGHCPVCFHAGQGSASLGSEGHFIVNVIAQAQGGGVYAVGSKINEGRKSFFLEIDFTGELHAVTDGGSAEGAGGEA